jgi:hypothetical protein
MTERFLVKDGNNLYYYIKRVEPIASAMKRDLKDSSINLEPKNIQSHEAFIEHVGNCKDELKGIKFELLVVHGSKDISSFHSPTFNNLPQHWDSVLT